MGQSSGGGGARWTFSAHGLKAHTLYEGTGYHKHEDIHNSSRHQQNNKELHHDVINNNQKYGKICNVKRHKKYQTRNVYENTSSQQLYPILLFSETLTLHQSWLRNSCAPVVLVAGMRDES